MAFTNGFMTPIFEPQVYASYVTASVTHELNLEESYNQIYVKVANQGDNTIITGIRIGNSATFALHHEWKKLGEWQNPLQIQANE